MTDYPGLSAPERLHLERFLRTSAQYLGVSSSERRAPERGCLCRQQFQPVRVPAHHPSACLAARF